MASLKSIIRQGKQTRGDLRKIREAGKVPAVVYGYGTKNVSVKVDEVEFIKLIREVGRNGVIELGVGSKQIKVMVSDYQYDSLKNQITHIDFLAINMTEERTVEVPVHLIGEAPGAKEGGVVEQPLFNLEITATPDSIPEYIEVDISELNVNDSLSVADVKVSGDFTIENEAEDTIVSVVAPTEEPTEEEIEAMEGASTQEEPEVVGESSEEEAKEE
ncbi:50S ribosomal protein L25/general stress protein Ctc [Staphylococcus pseudintermedius]|uniref:50S ribosomal protein L25/general stress protein Ctc n=1 Tax=Staphylococcus pseudintermedius TaxID=283734 RepID=UPI0019F0A94B|nr:50S ribosomal protein L25/general stress protein Ctc [Staphylococcus pseudintermedius]EGQ2711690.1 50S ribosomal protein L25/general stress protein Ctc [Staphylococcus pseudintermedius]EGQ4045257.1 50S ribosomal protein L25/general stress protein Ctc [Staphylococcus pseudintermedius]EJG1258210.1 50S ribosomal protein L25/general stress protein Ctc [Staphylococcus pseudintermedius]EKH7763141.1 50S ribosomal protein L25/general stress protein Ctc [Staphylococcus pseudintermedius]ELJ9201608.1 